jgi:ubiquinone/menaquinone biosynthesis C-methylase UbiE
VGWYRRHALPRIVDVACRSGPNVDTLRSRVCEGLRGGVVEIGFGSGLNIEYYPDAVTHVLAVEPSDVAWQLAGKRIASGPVPVERAGLDGQRLALPDDSIDSALSTWTLCTIPDPLAALREVARVLKPGGELHFVEHGLAPDAEVVRWQRRLNPLQRRMCGGCHLTRRIDQLVANAGFVIDDIDAFYAPKEPRTYGYTWIGMARPA